MDMLIVTFILCPLLGLAIWAIRLATLDSMKHEKISKELDRVSRGKISWDEYLRRKSAIEERYGGPR